MISMRRSAQTLALLMLVTWIQRHFLVSSSESYGPLRQRSNLDDVCSPWAYPIEAQCNHVREQCSEANTILSLPHLQGYFCAAEVSRPFVLFALLLWMSLLFSTLGICASDFLCPNLSTIAQVLGLDDSVAGVTLLAVGNGSPDLFATFSAMKTNSGSLAVGELLGAATFIVSVVVGSMCIIKPFHVHSRPFLRDVGFFTLATAVIFWILHDGILRQWEVNLLVGLYGLYVCLVVAGTWWENSRERRRLREAIAREEFVSDHPRFLEPYRDEEVSSTINLDVRPSRTRATSTPNPPRASHQVYRRSQSRSPPRLPTVETTMEPTTPPSLPHFSLLTALEFRDIVSSLQNETNLSTLSLFDNSIGSLGTRHYRTPSVISRYSASRDQLSPPPGIFEGELETEMLSDHVVPEHRYGPTDTTIPPIVVRTPSGQTCVSSGYKQTNLNIIHHIYNLIFPHLHDFSKKSFFNLLVAVLATPGVVALTLTVPVVPSPHNFSSDDRSIHISVPEGRLIDEQEDELRQALDLQESIQEDQFNKWLAAFQCVLGPPFCIVSLVGLRGYALWYILTAAVVGVIVGTLVLALSGRGNSPVARFARCLMGFLIAVVWIMIIADEVVSVLKAFGLIFGLSDAIIGLTIFAIGNSLADLVANTSIASFAPIMGFSACFGGPMLNILLGIGLSGSVIIQETGHNYNLHFSTTLLVNVVSLLTLLLSTLIFVPWNGYLLTRSWGAFLIVSYVVIMTISIFVEVRYDQKSHINLRSFK